MCVFLHVCHHVCVPCVCWSLVCMYTVFILLTKCDDFVVVVDNVQCSELILMSIALNVSYYAL